MKSALYLMLALTMTSFISSAASAQVTGTYYDRAITKSQAGDYYGAIADFTKVIDLYPNEAKPYHFRGICKFNLKDYVGAIADFSKAIDLNPKYSDAYYMRGMAKVGARDRKSSCPDFQKGADMGNQNAFDALEKYCK